MIFGPERGASVLERLLDATSAHSSSGSGIPWGVGPDSPRVMSEPGRCGYFEAVYEITVAGHRYGCSGGETKCARAERVEVAYDPERPEQCRVAVDAGEPSLTQWMFLSTGVTALAFATALLLWLPSFGGVARQRSRLRMASGIAFLACAALSSTLVIAHLVLYRGV